MGRARDVIIPVSGSTLVIITCWMPAGLFPYWLGVVGLYQSPPLWPMISAVSVLVGLWAIFALVIVSGFKKTNATNRSGVMHDG